jgi:hypothetical protein
MASGPGRQRQFLFCDALADNRILTIRSREHRFLTIGASVSGRLFVLAHTKSDDMIRGGDQCTTGYTVREQIL